MHQCSTSSAGAVKAGRLLLLCTCTSLPTSSLTKLVCDQWEDEILDLFPLSDRQISCCERHLCMDSTPAQMLAQCLTSNAVLAPSNPVFHPGVPASTKLEGTTAA